MQKIIITIFIIINIFYIVYHVFLIFWSFGCFFFNGLKMMTNFLNHNEKHCMNNNIQHLSK